MTYALVDLGYLVLLTNGVGVFGISKELFGSFELHRQARGDRFSLINSNIPAGMSPADVMEVLLEVVKKKQL